MKKTNSKKQMPEAAKKKLFAVLQTRFEKNMKRHKGLDWSQLQAKLEADPDKLWSLDQMEETGGEPDVVAVDKNTGEFIIVDCSPETPKDRRSICYDREGLESRKEARPANTAVDMAAEMGIKMLTEEQYRDLQKSGTFDTKTSSWITTPDDVRELGGALFGDFRYGRVFIYHNGAQSYYAARGFRGMLRV